MGTKSLSKEQVKGKLLQGTFANSAPAARLSDPIVDTPMVLTLEQLRPYDHNPRLNRNPRYDDLRASIFSRGLDAPPPVTRRPGEEHFIIRNGGNTRLAILNDLWRETNDERFFRIHCLFRPWPNRGEILALTGHLAESDLHGELTFIERALGVDRAREFYQLEVAALSAGVGQAVEAGWLSDLSAAHQQDAGCRSLLVTCYSQHALCRIGQAAD